MRNARFPTKFEKILSPVLTIARADYRNISAALAGPSVPVLWGPENGLAEHSTRGLQTGFQSKISPVHQSKGAPFGLDWIGGLTSPLRTYAYIRRTCVYVLLHVAYVPHLRTST
jgi:hypothetical protein